MSKIYVKKFNTSSTVIAYGSTMSDTNKTYILKKYNLKTNEYYLIVGRLIPDNNSKLIIENFIKSKSNKKLVVVGDVPYSDSYSKQIKKINSDKLILTGYINCQNELTQLYKNCYGYIHGHEYGGTNPTMINALFLNCEILALNTKFNREMLKKKKVVFFEKNNTSIKNSFNFFEKIRLKQKNHNKTYKMPKNYDWDFIADKYLMSIKKLIN